MILIYESISFVYCHRLYWRGFFLLDIMSIPKVGSKYPSDHGVLVVIYIYLSMTDPLIIQICSYKTRHCPLSGNNCILTSGSSHLRFEVLFLNISQFSRSHCST